ncbi:RNA polymerase sigma factor AlgU [Thalassolituus oleivorans R6-15]|uniref:AlgU gene product n=3 Tax=root TaxID=1 RepID=M5DN36_9GAMM|nr:RNA polymerase sigma factor AlgU [Thalassolituus oleivorans R6-15]CCU71350.1 algU gene product [Thalassolituus oleivorans MIL-1]
MTNLAMAATKQRDTAGNGMTDQQISDRQLVARVQKGDRRAFDLLVVKYQHRILALVGRFVSDFAEAQDVTQEAFIKAYRALPSFRGDSAFYTWMYRIAVNTAKNHLISRGRKTPTNDIDLDDAAYFADESHMRDMDTPDGLLQRDQLRDVVFAAIDALPEELRIAVTLREIDGLTYEEIADVMECPIGTVRSRIFRAREAIEKKMQPLLSATA